MDWVRQNWGCHDWHCGGDGGQGSTRARSDPPPTMHAKHPKMLWNRLPFPVSFPLTVSQCTVSLNQNSPSVSPQLDAVQRLDSNNSLALYVKRRLQAKYSCFIIITKEGFFNYKYNNRNSGKFCYLEWSGQVSFAFLIESWHLMPENRWEMSVNYSEKNAADNRNFRTIAWNNLSAYLPSPIQALAMCSLGLKPPLTLVGVLNRPRTGSTAHISHCSTTSAVTCDSLSLIPRSKISFTRSQKLSRAWVQQMSQVFQTNLASKILGCE